MYYIEFTCAQFNVIYYTSYKSVEILRNWRVNAHMTKLHFLSSSAGKPHIGAYLDILKKTKKHAHWGTFTAVGAPVMSVKRSKLHNKCLCHLVGKGCGLASGGHGFRAPSFGVEFWHKVS